MHEPKCFIKWKDRELAKPPSRRLPPPERPELPEGEGGVEQYNELAQAASDRCGSRSPGFYHAIPRATDTGVCVAQLPPVPLPEVFADVRA